jgi:hypothetical protein
MQRSIKRRSEKKKFRDYLGAMHLKILKQKRDNSGTCELCGRSADNIGRFHILRVGAYPKMEFIDDNILLTCWMPCHYAWHHFGKNEDKIRWIEERIKQLRGTDYEQRLKLQDKMIPHLPDLKMIAIAFKEQLKEPYD